MMGFGMGGLGSLLILGLIGYGIYYVVRERGGWSRKATKLAGDSALWVLRARYAGGEIDAEEFAARRRELQQDA